MTPHPIDAPRRVTPEWSAGPDGFILRLQADARNLAFARAAVAAFAARLAFTLEEIEDLRLAVSEMVTNAVVHAYDAPGGPLWIGGRVRDGALEVVVEDRGRGIEDAQAARRAGFSRLGGDHLGIGFSVIESYVDRLEIDSTPGEGTCVEIVKRPAALRASAAPV